MALVISGIADIGISVRFVTKETSEFVAFTDTLGYIRRDILDCLLCLYSK
jgi:hypothetical protein